MKQNFDCIVVGAGIAGMMSAIYLKRANKNVLLIESYIPGGQINKTTNIENFPGFTKIEGPTLSMSLLNQVSSLEIPLKYEKVVEIIKETGFSVKTNKNQYNATSIILASGRTPNLLGLDNEEELVGKGISYCALCDGIFFKGKDVIVVGGGNSAFQGALYLANICNKVTIINRSDKLKASMILQNRINSLGNVELLYNEKVKKINADNNKITSVNLKNRTINCDGIFIYIGSTPNLDYLSKLNIDNDHNYIIVDADMKTNVDLIYACGDIIKKNVYQMITAASDGAIAATNLQKEIEKLSTNR